LVPCCSRSSVSSCRSRQPGADPRPHQHTAADVHHGRASAIQAARAGVLTTAYQQHPERFVRKPPAPPKLPGTSWINPPEQKEADIQ
jgi:hypothetical protein